MRILFFYSLDEWDLDEDGLRALALAESAIETTLGIEEIAELIEPSNSSDSWMIASPPLGNGFYSNLGIGFVAWILDLPFPPHVGFNFRAALNTPSPFSDYFTEDLLVEQVDICERQFIFYLADSVN